MHLAHTCGPGKWIRGAQGELDYGTAGTDRHTCPCYGARVASKLPLHGLRLKAKKPIKNSPFSSLMLVELD